MRCRRLRRHAFTLIEVVVAMGILSLGVVSLLSVAGAAQTRIGKARDKWIRFHMLSQAVEFMMLQGFEDPELPGPDFFDYPNYQVQCEYEVVEDLPEELKNLSGQAVLKCAKISLIDLRTGETVDSVRIDRIDYDEVNDE